VRTVGASIDARANTIDFLIVAARKAVRVRDRNSAPTKYWEETLGMGKLGGSVRTEKLFGVIHG